jgi:hypothetical protein
MELILRPHQNLNDPVWSVIILLCCGLAFTAYCVFYILRLSFSEMEDNGSNDTPKQKELLQLQSDRELEGAISGDDDLVIRTELVGGVGKYGRLLGWLYIGDAEVSLNEQMIEEGYAWAYDGGTKQKDFEELREIRRAHGTLV